MKVLRGAVLVMLALATAAAAQTSGTASRAVKDTAEPSASGRTLDRVAAVVNDEVVLESEVWEQLQSVIAGAQTRPDSTQLDTLHRQALDLLINRKLVYAEAKKAGVTVPDAELDRLVDQEIERKRQQMGGEQGFNDALRNENLTLARVREQYRDQIRIDESTTRYVDRQVPRARVTQTEAEAFFTAHPDRFPKKAPEFRLALVQLPVMADSAAEAAGRIAALAARKRIVGGEKFAKVAAEVSEDPGTAHAGGDLGFFTRGTTVPEFEKVAFSQRIGVVSEPVRTGFGWHLIEVLERDTLKTRAHRDSLDAQGKPLEEAHVRHLLIRVDPTQQDADRAEALATSLRDRAVRGEDFGALARKYSRFSGPQSEGGEIGWVSLETLSPNIRAALEPLKPGDVSEPVASPAQPAGVLFNLFKVLEQRPEREFTLEEVREQIVDVVGRMKYNDKIDEWLKGLRAKATVEIKRP